MFALISGNNKKKAWKNVNMYQEILVKRKKKWLVSFMGYSQCNITNLKPELVRRSITELFAFDRLINLPQKNLNQPKTQITLCAQKESFFNPSSAGGFRWRRVSSRFQPQLECFCSTFDLVRHSCCSSVFFWGGISSRSTNSC